MAWPTTDVITTNTDTGADSPSLARADILQALQHINAIRNHVSAFAQTLLDDPDSATSRATLGLGNIENTSDAAKPISTSTQTALDAKRDNLAVAINKIINGGMQIAQRGTSFSNSLNTYTIDRWFVFGGPSNVSVTQVPQPSSVSASGFSLRFSRTAGETLVNEIGISTSLESKDSYNLAGKTVTLSFRAQKGANFSSAGNNLRVNIMYGTGTDEKSVSYTGSGSINGTVVLTDSPTAYKVTGVIPTTATEVGLMFAYTTVGTAGAADSFDLADVQLEIGSVASPFGLRHHDIELGLCQRYYRILGYGGSGAWWGTDKAQLGYAFDKPMRVGPTLALLTSTPTIAEVGILDRVGAGSTLHASSGASTTGARVIVTGFSGATDQNGAISLTTSLASAAAEL